MSSRHVTLNQTLPSFFRQQNMQWSCNMVHSHFTPGVRAREYMKQLSQHPWYVRPLDESQGSSPLQGHGTWLVCEVVPSKVKECLSRTRTLYVYYYNSNETGGEVGFDPVDLALYLQVGIYVAAAGEPKELPYTQEST